VAQGTRNHVARAAHKFNRAVRFEDRRSREQRLEARRAARMEEDDLDWPCSVCSLGAVPHPSMTCASCLDELDDRDDGR
jgi:hypothetical protein